MTAETDPQPQQRLLEGTPIDDHLTYRLARVQAKLNARATRLLTDHAGITLTQWRVLTMIASMQITRAADLVRIGAIDKGMVSRAVKQMVADDLLYTKRDSGDQRVQQLALTSKGQALYERTLPVMVARRKALSDSLSKLETDVLRRVLDKLESVTDAALAP